MRDYKAAERKKEKQTQKNTHCPFLFPPHGFVAIHDVLRQLVLRERVEGDGELYQGIHQDDEQFPQIRLQGVHDCLQQTLEEVKNRALTQPSL